MRGARGLVSSPCAIRFQDARNAPKERWTMRASLLLLLTPFAVGCSVDTTAPRPLPFQSRLSVMTASDESPKVIRFRDQFAFYIIDTKTDLLGFAGLPDDISRSADCGGTDSYAVVD